MKVGVKLSPVSSSPFRRRTHLHAAKRPQTLRKGLGAIRAPQSESTVGKQSPSHQLFWWVLHTGIHLTWSTVNTLNWTVISWLMHAKTFLDPTWKTGVVFDIFDLVLLRSMNTRYFIRSSVCTFALHLRKQICIRITAQGHWKSMKTPTERPGMIYQLYR